jgi:hypothetical protein
MSTFWELGTPVRVRRVQTVMTPGDISNTPFHSSYGIKRSVDASQQHQLLLLSRYSNQTTDWTSEEPHSISGSGRCFQTDSGIVHNG